MVLSDALSLLPPTSHQWTVKALLGNVPLGSGELGVLSHEPCLAVMWELK